MDIIKIQIPLTNNVIKMLKTGNKVLLSGIIYTARDEAHKKIINLILKKKSLPFKLKGSVIFYTGPTPARPSNVIGAIGPTTSNRMDSYTPLLLDHGVKGVIGKGQRSKRVIESIKKNKAVYFGAIGGAAALLSKSVVESEVIAFKELGPEAVWRLKVKNMPLIVINDCNGNDIYTEGKKEWSQV